MTLHLHDYGRAGVGAGGAPINYAEVSRLVLGEARLDARPHDFYAALAAGGLPAFLREVRDGDTVLCNVGPYAHLYHWWRERSGRDFRIVRDARTTAWAPYLAQEWLLAPFARPGDVIVFPSEFTRAFYGRLFPHVTAAGSRVLYPLAEHLPAAPPRSRAAVLRIGCLGRIADDKNVTDALDALATIRRVRDAELHLAGPFYPASSEVGSPAALARAAAARGLPGSAVRYHGNLPHEAIWAFLAGVDVLFFPAVSSNESFGRVIAEAAHAGVAVVAADFAAAPELLPAANLVPVRYRAVERARLSRPLSLGRPDVERAAAALTAGPAPGGPLTGRRFSRAGFLELVAGDGGDGAAAAGYRASPGARAFLEGARIDGIAPLGAAEAAAQCARQAGFMRSLNHPGLPRRAWAVARLGRLLPGDDVLRRVARERLGGAIPPGVLRNAVAAGRLVGFDPRLSLAPA